MNNQLARRVVKFTESLRKDNFRRFDFEQYFKLVQQSGCNLGIYEGILLVNFFSRFNEVPDERFNILKDDELFHRCMSIFKGEIIFSPSQIGELMINIFTLSDNEGVKRDLLMGCFYGALWPFMNDPKNFEVAVDYGVEMIKKTFAMDGLDVSKKIVFADRGKRIINLAGSGKKEIKLLNISSMAAIITAAVGKLIGKDIVVEKTISKATSSITGSGDIFELLGANLDRPTAEMAKISLDIGLGIFDINKLAPKLNHVYDGRLYDVQVFAGLIGGAAVVNPVEAQLINYGLTRGSTEVCRAILKKIYPQKDIMVIQGKNWNGDPVMDQISIGADTEIAFDIGNAATVKTITPRDFGFEFKPFKYVETKENALENLGELVRFLLGNGEEDLEWIVAMEVSLNLKGLDLVDELKEGADIALRVIRSRTGIDIVKMLISRTGGNAHTFDDLINAQYAKKSH